jgi:hypothetical protein
LRRPRERDQRDARIACDSSTIARGMWEFDLITIGDFIIR